MDKSVLVIDTPKTCIECPFCEELDPQEWWGECCITKKNIYAYGDEEVKVPEWCPLRSIPERCEDISYIYNAHGEIDGQQPTEYARGWNECIDELLGETE